MVREVNRLQQDCVFSVVQRIAMNLTDTEQTTGTRPSNNLTPGMHSRRITCSQTCLRAQNNHQNDSGEHLSDNAEEFELGRVSRTVGCV